VRPVAAFLAEIAPMLINQPVGAFGRLREQFLTRNYHLGTSGLHYAALAGIDIAVLDARGRAANVSVAELLGGAVRSEVPAYASIGYFTEHASLDNFTKQLEGAAGEGFKVAKIKIGAGVESDRERAEAALRALGQGSRIAVDYNANATIDTVTRSLRNLADLPILWVEEPLPPYLSEGWARVQELGVPISSGEAFYSRWSFRDHLVRGDFDIAQPDVAKCGLTESAFISELAATFNRRFSPHCWGSGVSQAATLQLLASRADAPFGEFGGTPQYLEFDRGENPLREGVLQQPIRAETGTVQVPQGPGLGVEIDEARLDEWVVPGHSLDVRG
jgi:D-galactarolactone cycloisomerase